MAKNDKVKVVVTGKVNTVTKRDRQTILGAPAASADGNDATTFIAYASALKTHINAGDIHITPAERDRWNRLSNIFVNGSINLENFVDNDSLATTLAGYIKTTTFNDLKNTQIIPHINNEEVHVTAEEKAFWNAKQPAGSYATKAEVDGKITVALSELNVNNLDGMDDYLKISVADTRYLRKTEADQIYATAEQLGAIDTRVETLENADFATKQDLADVSIALSNIPADVFTETNIGEKNIPQLADYYTKDAADQKFLTGNDYAAIENTFLKIDDAAGIYATQDALAQAASRIDASIAEAIAAYDGFAVSVHEELQDIERPMGNRLYLIPKDPALAHEGNMFTEYVFVNDSFEKVGADDVNPASFASAAEFAAHVESYASHVSDTIAHITNAERSAWNDVSVNFVAKVTNTVNTILQQNNFATLGNVQTVVAELREEISAIPKFKFQVVESLDDIETISTSTIYLVPDQGENEDDLFVEYINPTGEADAFERLGIQKRIDMTGYYTKAEVDTALAQLEARISTDSSTAAETYATKTDVSAFQAEQQLKDADIDASIDALQEEIVTKASAASVEAVANGTYTKEETANLIAAGVTEAVSQAKTYADDKHLDIDGSINEIKEILPTLINGDGLTSALAGYVTTQNAELTYLQKSVFNDAMNNYDASVMGYVAEQIGLIDYSDFATNAALTNYVTNTAFTQAQDSIASAIADGDTSVVNYFTGQINLINQQIEALGQNQQSEIAVDASLTEDGENAVQGKAIYKAIVDNEKVVSAGLNKAFEDIKGLTEDIEAINDTIAGNFGNLEVVSEAYDYIYDEESWNDSFENGALHRYYTKYPLEDLYNTELGRYAQFNDRQYLVDMIWADNTPETINLDAAWITADVQKMSDGIDTVYAKIIDFEVGGTYQVYRDQAMTELAGTATVTSITVPGFTQCWQGAVTAPGAKFPWICPRFDTDVNATIKFEYKGKAAVTPWGSRVFGTDKTWGTASVAEEFRENGFLIEANQANGNEEWSNDENGFDLSKFRMILVKQAEFNNIKSYIDQKFEELKFQLS